MSGAFARGRMAVAAVFPMFMLSVVVIRSVILFKRGTIRDKEVRPCPRSVIFCLRAWHDIAEVYRG